MKFRIGLLFLLFGFGQSFLSNELEPKYNLGEKVTIGDYTWEVKNIETKNPTQGKYIGAKLSSQPKIIYTFKRPILPYFLNKQFIETQFEQKQLKANSAVKFRKTEPRNKITPLGTITLGSVSLLALYGLYFYFLK